MITFIRSVLTRHPIKSTNNLILGIDESQLNHVTIDVLAISCSLSRWIIVVSVWRPVDANIIDRCSSQEDSSGEHAVVRINNRLGDSTDKRVICGNDEAQACKVVQNELVVATRASMGV